MTLLSIFAFYMYNGQFFKMKVLNRFNQIGELPINIVAAYAETNGNKTR